MPTRSFSRSVRSQPRSRARRSHMTKRIIVALLGLLAVTAAAGSADARWYGNGNWNYDYRWRGNTGYYYGYNYRAPPVVYSTPYNYGYYAPPVIYGAEPGLSFNINIP